MVARVCPGQYLSSAEDVSLSPESTRAIVFAGRSLQPNDGDPVQGPDLDFVDGDSDVAAGFVRWTGKVDGAQPDAFTILSNESDVPRYAEAYGDEGGTNGLSDFF